MKSQAAVTHAAVNVHAQAFTWTEVSVLLDTGLGAELLGHPATLGLPFAGTAELSSAVAVPFTVPPAVWEDRSTSSSVFVIIPLLH